MLIKFTTYYLLLFISYLPYLQHICTGIKKSLLENTSYKYLLYWTGFKFIGINVTKAESRVKDFFFYSVIVVIVHILTYYNI